METKGKVLLVGNDFEIHSKGYNLFKQTEKIGFINDKKYALLSQFKFTRRFFRAEITGVFELNDGGIMAIAKKGLFKSLPVGGNFKKVFTILRGSKPLNL